MNLYVFKYNRYKNNDIIELTYIDGNNVVYNVIGDIYNLVDYINYNIKDNAKLKFVNFTGNKLDFIVSAITRYKSIITAREYYSLIIKDKKRIRGR